MTQVITYAKDAVIDDLLLHFPGIKVVASIRMPSNVLIPETIKLTILESDNFESMLDGKLVRIIFDTQQSENSVHYSYRLEPLILGNSWDDYIFEIVGPLKKFFNKLKVEKV